MMYRPAGHHDGRVIFRRPRGAIAAGPPTIGAPSCFVDRVRAV
jgi:hypothetical protein